MKKEYRIKKGSDFDNIIKKKKSFANRQFVIYYNENKENDHMRLGISVSKKLGKAYLRNKLKRYVRECINKRKDIIKNYDIIIIVRQGAVNIPFQEFDSSINHILTKTKMYKNRGKK